jgi:hypothetical protein
MMLPVVV